MGFNFKRDNIDIGGLTICYRGWKNLNVRLINIGPTKMLCFGPVAFLWG